MLALQIATVPFELELPAGSVAGGLSEAWSQFRAEAAPAFRVRLTCDRRPIPQGPRTMPAVDGDSIRGAGFEATVIGTRIEVVGADEQFGVESVVKLLLARALLPRGGMLVHSVALAAGAFAAVLLGESGAGKSTLGELGLKHGLRCLSDELVAVLDGRALGTPWNTGIAAGAALKLLGTLGWAAAPRLESLSAADFLPLLLSNTLLPDENPATRAELFRHASQLLNAHSPKQFFFPPDERAAEFLCAWLQ